MKEPRNLIAVAKYLRSLDISKVNWMMDRPESDMYKDAKYDCADLVLKYIESLYMQIAEEEPVASYTGKAMFDGFIKWLRASNHPSNAWNSTNFGRKLSEYMREDEAAREKTSEAAITKGSTAKGVSYKLQRAPLQRFLKARGLLIDRGFSFDEACEEPSQGDDEIEAGAQG